MATRRSRIKAIVNVPARRAKASEESENSKISNSSSTSDSDKVITSPLDKNDSNHAQCPNAKGNSDEVHSFVKVNSPSSQANTENVSCTKNAAEDLTNVKDSESSKIDPTHDGELQNTNDVKNENIETIEKTFEKHDEQTNLEKSSPDETCTNASSDKVVANCSASKGGPIHSPLKQRPRLFIRPSPKLVDASGRRRYPSGSRHKTLSESEEEARTKAVVDDANLSLSESASRVPNSSHSKSAKSQEAAATNSQETAVGDAKKNSSRPGRQRAKNKENRACDSRRRLWQKMKKGSESVPLDRSRLTMFDYIYYNPVSNPMRSSSESSVISKEKDSEKRIENDALSEELVDDPGEGGSLLNQEKGKDDENEDAGVPAPRVKVGPNGELILDEQSLVIETTGLKEGLKDLANGPALIESSSFTNYATYRKRSKGHDWSDADTLRFYRALNVVGTDFSLMQSLLFNKRSRRDLKNKFKREERRNPALIEKALRYPGVFSNAEELQSEFASIEPPEKEKTEGKKGKGQKREKKCTPKSGQPPAKKKKRGKHWLVDGNVSQGEDSEDNGSIANELEKEVEADAGKSVDGGTPEVVFSVSSEEVMMASQEIVLTNEDSLPPSCGGKSEEESDASESSENGFLSRVLQPTRSGRIPKRREVKVLPKQRKVLAKEKSERSLKKETAVEELAHPTDHLEKDPLETDPLETDPLETDPSERDPLDDPRPTVSIEVRDCAPSNIDVSNVEPGSLVVIATTAPDDPSRKVYEVFMVAPQVQDSLLISQNVSIEENIGMIKGDSKIFSSINGGEGVLCPAEGFESCSIDSNVGLQT